MSEGAWHRGVRDDIIEFLQAMDYNPLYSHSKKGNIPLYRVENPGDKTGSANQLSDVDIVTTEDNRVRYLIEIENSTRPKHIFGVIFATNKTNYCKAGGKSFKIKNSILFVVVREYKDKSQKPEQRDLIQRALKDSYREGSLKDFIICTENDFQIKFLEKDI